MRIALVITEIYPGGAEKCFVNLACYLHRQGHEVRVWQLGPDPPPEKSQLARQLERQGISWSSGRAVKPWHVWRVTRWLKRELKQFRPEIVQAFLFHANLVTVLATRHLDCRLFGGARVAQPERWRQRLQRWGAKRMEKLICVSQSVADHLSLTENIPGDKLSVIPNGIDLEEWNVPVSVQWPKLGIPQDARVLLFVGRLTDQKGIVQFVNQSAPRVLQLLPDHHLVIMGEGDRGDAVRTLCRASPVGERLHVVGWQADALPWMRLAEMIILPAKYEGMPNVILEAMSVGQPVASFAVDGVRELLGQSPEANLQLVTPQDFVGLEALILQLAGDGKLRAACGANNRRRVEQHFELNEQLAKYEQLYLAAAKA